MNLIIDSNIIISALISPNGIISNIMFNKLKKVEFFAPNYLFHEIISKQEKIVKITGYSNENFFELLHLLTKKIDFIDETLISEDTLKKAYKYTSSVDPKDTYYVALALQMKLKIWTGDKKLIKGIRDKGFKNILDTKELLEIIT